MTKDTNLWGNRFIRLPLIQAQVVSSNDIIHIHNMRIVQILYLFIGEIFFKTFPILFRFKRATMTPVIIAFVAVTVYLSCKSS